MSLISTLEFHHHLLDVAESMKPLPATVSHLAATVADPDAEIDDVLRVLRGDPNLVAAILRESNSAASAPVAQIASIEAAVMRVGLARILALATGSMVGEQTKGPLESYELPAGAMWSHSVKCSYVAEAAYRMLGRKVGAEVVTAALLHDIGQIVLDSFLESDVLQQATVNHANLADAERELIDVDHAELGALLLELWKIPGSVSDAVRWHHHPEQSEGLGAHVLFVANTLTHEFDGDRDIVGSEQVQLAESLELLGLERVELTDRAESLLARAGLD